MARRLALLFVAIAVFYGCSSGDGNNDNLTPVSGSEANPLAAAVVNPPANFETSAESDAVNGTISADQLGDYLHNANAAKRMHLVRAYQATYDSTNDLESSILIVLVELESEADAAKFNDLSKKPGLFVDTRADPAVAPRVRKLAGVEGGTLVEPTKIDEAGIFDHGAVAAKGNKVMFIDYITTKRGRVPLLPRLARDQFAVL